MSISERAPSIEFPGSVGGQQAEWAIKGPAKLKYTQLFNDRTRNGLLTGAYARGIFMRKNSNHTSTGACSPLFQKVTSRNESIVGSRHESVSSRGAGAVVSDIDAMGLPNSTSFEDKRKENFDKGQAELDRRRKLIEDAKRKELEKRQRKDREETEKLENARIKAELKTQQ
uniref:CSON001910 protein n=1 Tax=Culicoides sonorensis TaxID=179676 RepID=A0A336KZG4_CULSO